MLFVEQVRVRDLELKVIGAGCYTSNSHERVDGYRDLHRGEVYSLSIVCSF